MSKRDGIIFVDKKKERRRRRKKWTVAALAILYAIERMIAKIKHLQNGLYRCHNATAG